jgi:hypothetical protein
MMLNIGSKRLYLTIILLAEIIAMKRSILLAARASNALKRALVDASPDCVRLRGMTEHGLLRTCKE